MAYFHFLDEYKYKEDDDSDGRDAAAHSLSFVFVCCHRKWWPSIYTWWTFSMRAIYCHCDLEKMLFPCGVGWVKISKSHVWMSSCAIWRKELLRERLIKSQPKVNTTRHNVNNLLYRVPIVRLLRCMQIWLDPSYHQNTQYKQPTTGKCVGEILYNLDFSSNFMRNFCLGNLNFCLQIFKFWGQIKTIFICGQVCLQNKTENSWKLALDLEGLWCPLVPPGPVEKILEYLRSTAKLIVSF